MRSRCPPWVLPLLAKKASSQSHISCASRVGLLTWQRRPRATRTAAHLNLRSIRTFMIVFGLLSSVFDILTFHPPLGFHASATPSAAAGSSNRPSPNSPSCSSCAPTGPSDQSHPALCCHPSPSPPSRSPCPPARWPDHSASPPSRPGSWPPSPGSPRSTSSPTRGQTSLPLMTRSQTPRRPWPWMSSSPAHHAARCHLGLPAWQAASCGRDAGKSRRAPALPLQQGRPNQSHLLAARGAPDRARAGKLGQRLPPASGSLRAGPTCYAVGRWVRCLDPGAAAQ